jgi:formylglycine-generating enzyme required for sulfatase activity
MIPAKIIMTVLGALAVLTTTSALRAQSIGMSYVTVGNPGNASDPANDNLYGSVSYTYNIGEYDVTDSQYCTFLNDVDPTGANTLALYSPTGNAEYGITYNSASASGSKYSVISGYANMPAVGVDYWDTLRFVNWMNNGEGNASTETGAYTLIGGNAEGYGMPSNYASLLENPQHNAGATVWLPNENEWYKAAYYDPANGTYSTYATQSDTTPGNDIGGGSNEANSITANGFYSVTQSTSLSSTQNALTPVGSFTDSSSYYGTYDQSGDVSNWIATTSTVESSDFGYPSPDLLGGQWDEYSSALMSGAVGYTGDPVIEDSATGFRVASEATAVPEPSTFAMLAAGVGALIAFRRSR